MTARQLISKKFGDQTTDIPGDPFKNMFTSDPS